MAEIFSAVQGIALTDKIILDLWIYFFSFLAFALMPKHIEKWLGWILIWFASFNVLTIFLPEFLSPWNNTYTFALLSQGPWIGYVLAMYFKKSFADSWADIPLRQYLLWQSSRLMGFHFAMAIWGAYVYGEYGIGVGLSEVLTGLGAMALWFFYRPENNIYRLLLLFWNTYGLTSIIAAIYKGFFSNPGLSVNLYSREIFRYLCDFPQAWVYFFWFPCALILHLGLFFKLYQGKEKAYL